MRIPSFARIAGLHTAIAATAVVGIVIAAGISSSDLTTFEAGEPVRAAEFNDNFAVISSAINDNHERLLAVESALAALQAGADDFNVAGETYRVYRWMSSLATGGMGATINSFTNISTLMLTFTLTFNEDGSTGTFAIGPNDIDTDFEVNLPGNNLSDFSSTEPEADMFTYQQNGSEITLMFGDGEESELINFTVSRGKSVITSFLASKEEDAEFIGGATGPKFDSELFIGLRQ